ncbi:MAG: hypothetical protein KA124_05320 [Luteimonas sp.]|nr:hypothetical protein [Luteimonas sp.]
MHIRSAITLSLLLAAATPAFAHDHGKHAEYGGAPVGKAVAADTRLTEDHFDALDADRDGFIAKSELPSGHPLAGHFSMADRSRDGRLDRREFKALLGMQ